MFKDCQLPIMSFGIICFRSNGDYLLIQRKDSLCFMEFIRGKYDIFNVNYIKELLSNMTEDERKMISTLGFEELWNRVWFQPHWGNSNYNRHTHDYMDSKRKFETLATGFTVIGTPEDEPEMYPTSFVKLSLLLQSTSTEYTEPEWGFPKGRRRLREYDVDCAIREFCEETGFTKNDIKLFNYGPLEEVFYGTNHILYRHVYYIAHLHNNENKDIVIDSTNVHQAREVRQVSWFNFDAALNLIRKHNKERRNLFCFADKIIKSVFLPNLNEPPAMEQSIIQWGRTSNLSPFAPTFYPGTILT